MPKPTQQELENLVKLFLSARDQLIDTVINYRGVGTKVYANTILKQLEKQLKRMERQSAYYVESVIPVEYQKGLDEVYGYFKRNNLMMSPPAAFAQLHGDMIYMVAREMQYQIGQGLEQAGRQVIRYVEDARDDALRMVGLEATGEKLASGSTVRQMQQNLVGKLQSQGFMTVQYGSGKRAYQVSLDAYAAMVARSTTREAGNLARETQLTANGYDLVRMTSHYPTCEICAQFQGRVYSISGDDKRFPPLSRAFSSGYRNIHPNCRHSVHPYIESLQSEEDLAADIARSNRPFEDNRPDAERALYNKQQVRNRQIRQDRYQYERYRARLGDDAPKSFHAFRKLKNAGGEGWGIIEAQYKGMGYYDKAVKAEPTITAAVKDVGASVGMDPVGLDYRVKSKDSYLRKIRANYNPGGNEYEVKDILRYTLTSDADSLANKTTSSIDTFSHNGYNTSEVKNYWLDKNNPYNGINTVVRTLNGQPFEVQYHTPESFAVKNGEMHKLYEQWRSLPKDAPLRSELETKMAKLSESMQKPPGIERVK